MIPDRFLRILRSAEDNPSARFPPTEVFNESWMLRLVLDAVQVLRLQASPLRFESGAAWYSEALLASPFSAQQRTDRLSEGYTNADGVVGQFAFRSTTRAGLELAPEATQFVVVEAKMFSNLSVGTKNAPAYNQAARNVACMAAAIARAARTPTSFLSLGFFVVAPTATKRRPGISNLEEFLDPECIRATVHRRIEAYERAGREEAAGLRAWEARYFRPLVQTLADRDCLKVLTWEACIDAVASADKVSAEELGCFYDRCLSFAGPERPVNDRDLRGMRQAASGLADADTGQPSEH